MKPQHCFNPNNFEVDFIDKDLIQPFIEKYHYLHRLKLGVVRDCFSIEKLDESRLIGVLVFGEPVRRELSKSFSPMVKDNEITELLRVFVEDGHGSNIESWAIAQAFQLLPPERKLIVSYADPSHVDEHGTHHIGRIYQALNGYYQELPRGNSLEVSTDGVTWLHERTQGRYYGKHSIEKLKKKIGHDFWIKRESGKYRYFWLRGGKTERNGILDTLKYPISPYPKNGYAPKQIEKIVVE